MNKADAKNIALLMGSSRDALVKSGISMRGQKRQDEGSRRAIRALSTSYAPAGIQPDITPDIKIGLLERFEEMCCRHDIEVPAKMRPAILAALLGELQENLSLVHEKPVNLLPVTAYNGAIASKLRDEFKEFSDTSSVLKRAMIGSPTNPRVFMLNVRDILSDLGADVRFAAFPPHVLLHSAMHNTTDPQRFLDKVSANITRLDLDKRFDGYPSGLKLRAAVQYPNNPEKWLEEKPTSSWAKDVFSARQVKSGGHEKG